MFQIGSAAVSIGIAEAAFAGTVAHTTGARFEHLNESLASALPGIARAPGADAAGD